MYISSTHYVAKDGLRSKFIVRRDPQNINKTFSFIGSYTPTQCAIMRKKAETFCGQAVDKRLEDSSLTQEDKEAWWEYLKHYLPKHYILAMALKDGEYDNALQRRLGLAYFTYNQLFMIYGLPTVRTKNHKIIVNDKVAAEIKADASYRYKRELFYICHSDRKYHAWKKYQFDHCQHGKCAWCERYVDYDETQVDHVQPLIFGGVNASWNLVVACKHCNTEKFADTNGWNDGFDETRKNQKKSWIGKNPKDLLWRSILEDARKKMQAEDKKIAANAA